ncbi:hypothetical protein VIGAN_04328500 [Vigna angularis var. angularis]|uniref:Uncharacterized protein n=1 Tax=Vigna angularis var. angularis TaxID=157739 RepID=A0A0S3RYQ8_PHAAN|nr:hypothetical protein VIGAN_04328500 [Vigna angularis var. angularis]
MQTPAEVDSMIKKGHKEIKEIGIEELPRSTILSILGCILTSCIPYQKRKEKETLCVKGKGQEREISCSLKKLNGEGIGILRGSKRL